MPLSKNFIEKTEADHLAVDYQPRHIDGQLTAEMKAYTEKEHIPGDFKVDKVLAEYVGIDEIEKESQQKEVAKQALELSKEIQEKAYSEAYELGLKEGREKAYNEEKENIAKNMDLIRKMIGQIKILKKKFIKNHEDDLVHLCFYMAQKLLFKEVERDEEYISTVLRKMVEGLHKQENMIIYLSPEDFSWFEAHRDEVFTDLHLDKSTRIEADESIQRGGLILETDYGEVDATIQQRISKLESILVDNNSF